MMNENYMDEIIKRELKKETIEVPEDIKSKINDTLVNLNTRKKKKTKLKIAISVAAIFVAFLTLGITMPAYAQNIPIIGSIFKLLDNGFYEEYDEYASDINVTKESNGVKVTISSIVYDGIDLNVAYTVESDKKITTNIFELNKEVTVNGKKTSFGLGASGKYIEEEKTYVGIVSFHTYADGVPSEIQKEQFYGGYVEIPDEFVLGLRIYGGLAGEKIDLSFNIPVTSEKVKGKVKELVVNKDLSLLGEDYKINKLIITPINTFIQGTSKKLVRDKNQGFMLMDDKGRTLGFVGGGGSEFNEAGAYFSHQFKALYPDTKTLTFIPFRSTTEFLKVLENNEKSPIYSVSEKLNLLGETKIKLKNDEIIITKIVDEGETSKVYFKTRYPQLNNIRAIKAEDSEKEDISEGGIQNSESGFGEYFMTFNKLDRSKSYMVYCEDMESYIDILEDSKFTVNLD